MIHKLVTSDSLSEIPPCTQKKELFTVHAIGNKSNIYKNRSYIC